MLSERFLATSQPSDTGVHGYWQIVIIGTHQKNKETVLRSLYYRWYIVYINIVYRWKKIILLVSSLTSQNICKALSLLHSANMIRASTACNIFFKNLRCLQVLLYLCCKVSFHQTETLGSKAEAKQYVLCLVLSYDSFFFSNKLRMAIFYVYYLEILNLSLWSISEHLWR